LQHPTARPREIKAAYYNLVREHHPDKATNDGFDSTAFCALLNQIYQTLSDPDARAMYDAIAGFSVESVNPFVDTSFPADQVFVDEVGGGSALAPEADLTVCGNISSTISVEKMGCHVAAEKASC
jgi:DnaJ-class molecular chaperone